MKIIKVRDYEEMSRKVAGMIAAQVILKPESVLGLATGSTPVGVYKELVGYYSRGEVDFSEIITINLDEYKGLGKENKQSYRFFMDQHLFDHINVRKEQTFLPDGTEADSELACKDYDRVIEKTGGVDLQLLGLGHNGHIGFNEPNTVFVKATHCVNLSKRTIQANQRFFSSERDVPKQAYTMGIQTIMNAKKILVIVSGQDKADIVKKAFFGPVTPMVPASILQMHQDVTVVADYAALSSCDL